MRVQLKYIIAAVNCSFVIVRHVTSLRSVLISYYYVSTVLLYQHKYHSNAHILTYYYYIILLCRRMYSVYDKSQSVHKVALFQTKRSQISVFSIDGIDNSVGNKLQQIQPDRIEVLFI